MDERIRVAAHAGGSEGIEKPRLRIGPQPGSQERFLASRADIVFYGGEAGSSKTAGLVLEGLRCHDIPTAGGIMFRRTSPQPRRRAWGSAARRVTCRAIASSVPSITVASDRSNRRT